MNSIIIITLLTLIYSACCFFHQGSMAHHHHHRHRHSAYNNTKSSNLQKQQGPDESQEEGGLIKQPDPSMEGHKKSSPGRSLGSLMKRMKTSAALEKNVTEALRGVLGGGAKCAGAKCSKPPFSDASCTFVNPSDSSIPRPSGHLAECCPMYKCINNSNKSSFLFHGSLGVSGSPPSSFATTLLLNTNSTKVCKSLKCKDAPSTAFCSVATNGDKMPIPSAKTGVCCPLFKCVNSDGTYFPFNGAFGKGPTIGKDGKVIGTPPPTPH